MYFIHPSELNFLLPRGRPLNFFFLINENLLMLKPFFACLKVFFIYHKLNGYLAGFKNLDWEVFFFFFQQLRNVLFHHLLASNIAIAKSASQLLESICFFLLAAFLSFCSVLQLYCYVFRVWFIYPGYYLSLNLRFHVFQSIWEILSHFSLQILPIFYFPIFTFGNLGSHTLDILILAFISLKLFCSFQLFISVCCTLDNFLSLPFSTNFFFTCFLGYPLNFTLHWTTF